MIGRKLALALAVSLISACSLAQFTDGQPVEVREGDAWSPATVVKREGRRYQIRYQGGTEEEWVTSDRVRTPGAASPAAAPQVAPQPAQSSAASPPAGAPYKPGQELESKRGPTWRLAKFQKEENGWLLVLYIQGNYMEWVEPWRIRATGSKEDLIGTAPMNKEAKAGDPAPSTPPAEASGAIAGVAGWREPIVGDRAIYLDGWKVQPARVISQKGDQFTIQLDEGRNSKTVDAKDVRLAGLRFDAKIGQRVQIREPQGWASGTIMARETDRVRVMKDGWTHEMHHVWRGLDELRPMTANDVPPMATASADDLRKIPGYKDANASSARQLNLLVARATQYTPDAIATADLPALQLTPVTGANEPYSAKAIVVSRSGKFAAVSSHAMRKDTAMVDRIDLATGDHLNTAQVGVPADMVALDLSPDGTRVLLGAPRNGERLEIWSINGSTPKRQLLLFPYADGKNIFEKQIKHAVFVADDRILTIANNVMHVWDTTTGRAIYTAPAASESRPAISPSGKYIAFSTGKDALIIEATTGKGIMDLPLELSRATAMSFSADGNELVACDSANIYGVDLTTGKLAHDFTLPGNNSFRSIASPAPGFALANESILIDLKTKAPAMKYKLGASPIATTTPAGQVLFTYTGGRAPMLVTATVPHASALKQLQQIQGQAPRQMLLEPGAKVSLVVNLPGAESSRESVTAYLKNQLTTNGFTIADFQPLALIVSLDRGQPIEQEYSSGHRFGPFARAPEKVSVAPWISRLRLMNNGTQVWEVSATTGGPSFILMKKDGQTAQQAADEQNKPNTAIFTATRIPAYMVMPANPLHKFESEFTGRNFRDTPATPDAPPNPNPNDPKQPTPQPPDGKVA